ncbi:MAG: hypothetical protein JWM04_2038 [Verrucomicrobiales bacterium]|nr:hypothetical protein [Verrucomicrobiales bacterium]
MRVGISTTMIQRGKTGIAQYLFALTRAFGRLHTKIEPVLFVLEEDMPLFAFAEPYCELAPVAEKFRSPVRNILWHQLSLPGEIRKRSLDLFHVPSYRRMLGTAPCPSVATIHDLAPFHVTKKYDWKRMFYGRVVARRLAARQDEIIAISKQTAGDIEKYFGVPRGKINLIYNGLDRTKYFPGEVENIPEALKQIDLTIPYFLYVARLEHPAKNHVRLISAFEKFKKVTSSHWQLVFAGADWHGAEVIHHRMASSSVRNEIHSLGFVPDADLSSLYRAAGCFVFPSMFEGFGLPPLEAMASGCPVISSTRGSLAEVVGDAVIPINPESEDEMAHALAQISGSEALRISLSRNGIEHAKKFDWGICAQQTVEVYHKALRKSAQVASEPALLKSVG